MTVEELLAGVNTSGAKTCHGSVGRAVTRYYRLAEANTAWLERGKSRHRSWSWPSSRRFLRQARNFIAALQPVYGEIRPVLYKGRAYMDAMTSNESIAAINRQAEVDLSIGLDGLKQLFKEAEQLELIIRPKRPLGKPYLAMMRQASGPSLEFYWQ